MGRQTQTKVTDAYAVQKSTGLKMTVKRKVLREEGEDGLENMDRSAPPPTSTLAPSLEYVDNFQAAKNALHTAPPSTLIGREEEMATIYGWLDSRLSTKSPGSMYISGAPGTGKTAVVRHSIEKWLRKNPDSSKKRTDPIWHLVFNCMGVKSPSEVYAEMASTLGMGKWCEKEDLAAKLLNKAGKKMMVLVLDEMDQLLTLRGTDLLYTLFDWASLPGSHFVLIGIANALDPTIRHLPLLNHNLSSASSSPVARSPSATSASKPRSRRPTNSKKVVKESTYPPDLPDGISPMQVINFSPYQREDIENILEARLLEIGAKIFEPGAIKFVATKVAATTGDMRKALNACKLALDAVERAQREALKSTADDGFNFSSPKKFCIIREKINVGMVSKVFAPPKDDGPLPLQQMILLATLLRLNKLAPHSKNPKADGISVPLPMIQVYEEYRRICAAKNFSWIDRSEIVSVGSMLADRSLVTVVENMGGGVGKGKKALSTMTTANKTGLLISNFNAVDKIVMGCDMKSIVVG